MIALVIIISILITAMTLTGHIFPIFDVTVNTASDCNKMSSELWTLADDRKEKELFLQNPTAFWLNPNRYGANGEYDLLAEPYVESEVGHIPRSLGKWEYVKPSPSRAQIIRM